MAGQAEKEETRHAILEAFGTAQGRAMIRQDLRTAKTLERLRAIVTGQVAAAAPAAASRDRWRRPQAEAERSGDAGRR